LTTADIIRLVWASFDPEWTRFFMFKKCLDTQQGTGVQESRRLILNGHFFKGDAFKDSTLQESFTL